MAAVLGICVLLLVCSGCASTSAPVDWVPSAAEAQKEAYGAWADVTVQPEAINTGTGQEESVLRGELIAVSDEFLYVLTYRPEISGGGHLVTVSRNDVVQVRLDRYDSAANLLALWPIFGALSTISHGAFLVLSAPIWIIGGGASVSRHSYAPIYTYPSDAWDGLAGFARFPQGLPAGIETSDLRPKYSIDEASSREND